jgi:hypothetical protein
MKKEARNFYIEVALLVMIALAVGTAIVISQISPLDRNDIRLEVGDLRSFASAGAELADQFASKRTTETFFNSQARLIGDKVKTSAQTLRDGKAKPEAERERVNAAELASELNAKYEALLGPSLDLDIARNDLKKLAAKLRELEESMK